MRYTIVVLLFFSSVTFAQLDVNASIKSRYIWRGIDFGNSPTILPALTYTTGNLSVGIAGAYSFPDTAAGYAENDFWLEYRIPLSSGTLSLLCTDLYFPSFGKKFFDFSDNGRGAHTVEAGVQYMGPETFPLIVRVYRDIYNDLDFSSYCELEYPLNIKGVGFNPITGIVLNKSAVYGTEKAAWFLLGITATKTIELSSAASVVLSTSWMVNLYHERSYVVVGISL